jgi:hypothetical protein
LLLFREKLTEVKLRSSIASLTVTVSSGRLFVGQTWGWLEQRFL